MTIQIKKFNTINDIPKDDWAKVTAKKSLTFSCEFWEIVENSKLDGFSNFTYFIMYNEEKAPVGITTCYVIKSDMAIFSPKKIKFLLNIIRKICPNFLKFNFLECGTPVTINTPPIIILNDKYKNEILTLLNKQFYKIAVKKKCLMIVCRDFEETKEIEVYRRIFKKMRYSWLKSLPNTYMKINWSSIDNYVSSMKSYYRSKLLKHLQKNISDDISYSIIDDFKDISQVLYRQWIVIYNNATEMKREILTPEFYKLFSEKLGSDSKVILFKKKNKLIGHALLLKDNDLLRWMYIGREKSVNDSLYIYIIYCVIEAAINMKIKELELGVTTYSIKRDAGARIVKNYIAVRLIIPFCNLFVPAVYNFLNSPDCPNDRPVFKY